MKEIRVYLDALRLLLHSDSDSSFALSSTREPLPSGLSLALQRLGLVASLLDESLLTDDERPTTTEEGESPTPESL
jgi:hypothetical protein